MVDLRYIQNVKIDLRGEMHKDLFNSSSNIFSICCSHCLNPYRMVASKSHISNHHSASLPSHCLMQ